VSRASTVGLIQLNDSHHDWFGTILVWADGLLWPPSRPTADGGKVVASGGTHQSVWRLLADCGAS